MSENYIQDKSSNHRYHTQIPNIIFELKLTSIQLAIYLVLKRTAGDSGACTKSSKRIAEEAQINIKSYRTARDFLCQVHPFLNKPLIMVTPRIAKAGDQDTNEIIIVDIWPESNRFFDEGGGVKNGGTSKNGGRVGPKLVGGVGPKTVYKEEPYEEEPIKNSSSTRARPVSETAAASAIIYFRDVKGHDHQISESDIFTHFLKLPYSTEIVQQSIAQFREEKGPVGNALKLLEAIAKRLSESPKENKSLKTIENMIPKCTGKPVFMRDIMNKKPIGEKNEV